MKGRRFLAMLMAVTMLFMNFGSYAEVFEDMDNTPAVVDFIPEPDPTPAPTAAQTKAPTPAPTAAPEDVTPAPEDVTPAPEPTQVPLVLGGLSVSSSVVGIGDTVWSARAPTPPVLQHAGSYGDWNDVRQDLLAGRGFRGRADVCPCDRDASERRRSG